MPTIPHSLHRIVCCPVHRQRGNCHLRSDKVPECQCDPWVQALQLQFERDGTVRMLTDTSGVSQPAQPRGLAALVDWMVCGNSYEQA